MILRQRLREGQSRLCGTVSTFQKAVARPHIWVPVADTAFITMKLLIFLLMIATVFAEAPITLVIHGGAGISREELSA